jgi:hypothetical protein
VIVAAVIVVPLFARAVVLICRDVFSAPPLPQPDAPRGVVTLDPSLSPEDRDAWSGMFDGMDVREPTKRA